MHICGGFTGHKVVYQLMGSQYLPGDCFSVDEFSSGCLEGSARNNSRPLAAFGQPKSVLVGQISCTFSMGQQSVTYKILSSKKAASQFLILISSTVNHGYMAKK